MSAREYVGAGSNTAVRGMMASTVHTWETPPELFAELDAEFHFTLDPCCVAATAKCARFFTPADDGLSQSWAGERVFMNPPYGRELATWMKKAQREARNGALVVCLVPARTGTAWWHDLVLGNAEVRYLRGRVAFLLDGKRGDPTFDSAVVIYRPPVAILDVIAQLDIERFMIEYNRLPATPRYLAVVDAIAALRALACLDCESAPVPASASSLPGGRAR